MWQLLTADVVDLQKKIFSKNPGNLRNLKKKRYFFGANRKLDGSFPETNHALFQSWEFYSGVPSGKTIFRKSLENLEILDIVKKITKVIKKVVGPDWRPTEAMRKRDPQLPEYMPSGPDNPLGSHALYLSWPNYRIHGTSDTRKIGRQSSSRVVRKNI